MGSLFDMGACDICRQGDGCKIFRTPIHQLECRRHETEAGNDGCRVITRSSLTIVHHE